MENRIVLVVAVIYIALVFHRLHCGNGCLMGLAVKTWLVLLFIGSTYVTTCSVTAKKLWLTNREQQPPKDSAWSYSRFTREAMNGNTFNKLFRPLKCNPQARDLKACAVDDETNKTICLLKGCCFKDRPVKPCYHMTINKPQQILNIFAIGSVSILLIAVCPLLCCLLTQRTRLNSLRHKNQAVEDAKMKDTRVGAYILSMLQEHKKEKRNVRTREKTSTKTDVPSADISHGAAS